MEQPTTQAEHKSRQVAGRDDGPVNKYFSIVPHIDDDDLDLYEYRLLGHYRKLFGLGLPPETNSQTAIVTGMSVKAVRAARQRLVEKRRITINELTGVVVLVSLVDVMAENVRRYTNNPSPKRQGLDMTYPYPKRKGGYAQKGRGGMPKKEGVTPDEPSSDAGKTPPKELEEEKNTDSSSLHSEESRASAQSASHGTPADPGGKIDTTPKAPTLPPPSVSGNGTNTPPAEPTPAEVAAALERQAARFDRHEAGAVLARAAERRTLDPAPVGFEWWFAGDNSDVAHLKAIGKTPATRPLCKPKRWAMPNMCMNFQIFVACPDCVRIAAEPKAEHKSTIVTPLNNAVALYIQEIDPALADGFTGVLAQVIAGVWRKKLDRDLTADDYAAIARSLEPTNDKGFIKFYRRECKDCSLPNDKTRLRRWYAKFVTALDKLNKEEGNVDDTGITPEFAAELRRRVEERLGKQGHGGN